MRIKLLKDIPVNDDQGAERFVHETGTCHDWNLKEAGPLCDAQLAEPDGDEAIADYAIWSKLDDADKSRYVRGLKPRAVAVSDSGSGEDTVE